MYRIALMIVGLAVCLLPSFIAIYRGKRYRNAIVVLNLLVGATLAAGYGLKVWGLLGAGFACWAVIMAWSLWPETRSLTGQD